MRATDLKAARLNRGMSCEQLAKAAGVSHRVIRNVEEGRQPHPRNAKKIADYFGTTVVELWPIDDDEPVAA